MRNKLFSSHVLLSVIKELYPPPLPWAKNFHISFFFLLTKKKIFTPPPPPLSVGVTPHFSSYIRSKFFAASPHYAYLQVLISKYRSKSFRGFAALALFSNGIPKNRVKVFCDRHTFRHNIKIYSQKFPRLCRTMNTVFTVVILKYRAKMYHIFWHIFTYFEISPFFRNFSHHNIFFHTILRIFIFKGGYNSFISGTYIIWNILNICFSKNLVRPSAHGLIDIDGILREQCVEVIAFKTIKNCKINERTCDFFFIGVALSSLFYECSFLLDIIELSLKKKKKRLRFIKSSLNVHFWHILEVFPLGIMKKCHVFDIIFPGGTGDFEHHTAHASFLIFKRVQKKLFWTVLENTLVVS